MATRPYLNKSIFDLEAMATEDADRELLRALEAELEHRTTQRAIKLRERVKEQLKGKPSAMSAQPPLPGFETSSKKPRDTSGPRQQAPSEDSPPSGNHNHSQPNHERSDETRQRSGSTAGAQSQTTKKGVIRPPGNLAGVPSPRTFELDKTLKLNVSKGASNATVYEAALKELVKEMKREGAGLRQILLRDGQSVHLDGQDFGYQFRYDDEADLFEGAAVTASVGGIQAEGKIAAVMGDVLLITLSANFGSHIDTCLLKVDNTAMLEALRARLEKIVQGAANGFNQKMADAVVANTGDMVQPSAAPEASQGLNKLQQQAVAGMLANEIYFLWGPPGTGKTETLSALALLLMEQKKRLLVCSNTNQAVDQILLKLCKRFGAGDPLVNDGGIIRVGTISHNELQRDWADKITVDGIVERRSVELRNRRAVLQPKLDALNQAAARASEVVSLFNQLDKLQAEAKRQAELFQNAVSAYKRAEETRRGLVTSQQELEKERAAVVGAGTLRRLVMRSLEKIDADLAQVARELARAESLLLTTRDQRQHAQEQATAATEAAETFRRSLAPYTRSAAEKELEEFDSKRRPILDELAEIEKQLNDIRKTVLDGARIIGATVTKAYLSSQMFSAFDVVVIDEASMVMLPALYHAAGMAKEKVIVSGDSKQLAPIVPTNQQAIFDAIGKSVFDTARIDLDRKSQLKRVTMLEEQYRMEDSICQLISPIYNNRLKTSKFRREALPVPSPFNMDLTIIDTSSVGPFVNRDVFKSRYNVMNALAIRNLCRYFAERGSLTSNRDVGVATPYAAQSKLLKQALAEFGDTLQAGTSTSLPGRREDGDDTRYS